MQRPEISIVIPLYNEENVFAALTQRLNQLKTNCPYRIEIVLIDDGSKDETPILMQHQAEEDASYHCVFLSRNYGHQTAISAGMQFATATEAVMLMDGDLQDPPELLETFYAKIREGYEVVYAVRKKRKEGQLKKLSYWAYYRLQNMLIRYDTPLDSGDFSMVSRRVLDHINEMPEQSRFIRGLRWWVGFKQTGISYERDKRFAGKTKYSLKKLVQLAYDGVFNFSDFPLKLITRLGVVTITLSFFYAAVVVLQTILYRNSPKGFTTLIIVLTLFSGVQLISIGVLGEYVSRIFTQVKQRPLFLIKKRIKEKQTIYG